MAGHERKGAEKRRLYQRLSPWPEGEGSAVSTDSCRLEGGGFIKKNKKGGGEGMEKVSSLRNRPTPNVFSP